MFVGDSQGGVQLGEVLFQGVNTVIADERHNRFEVMLLICLMDTLNRDNMVGKRVILRTYREDIGLREIGLDRITDNELTGRVVDIDEVDLDVIDGAVVFDGNSEAALLPPSHHEQCLPGVVTQTREDEFGQGSVDGRVPGVII